MKFYIDTSVFGGYFDREFKEDTSLFFQQIHSAKNTIIVSDEVVREILNAPARVGDFFLSLPSDRIEIFPLDEAMIELAKHYIEAGALTKRYISDAQHIAAATIMKSDALISWNFTHMVNFFRIKQYNAINRKFGYSPIDIRSPKEVLDEK
jgi:hypothetical protein